MIARLALSAAFALILAGSSQASQVLWGSARLANNYLSSGSPAKLGSEFTFQLGAFEPGFTPSAGNMGEWLSNWTPAQSKQYNENTRFFTGSFVYQNSISPFIPNNQGYIFGFNRWATSEGGEDAEWILATNPNWRWPSGGGISPPVQWSMSNASVVVVGTINDPSGSFHMRTAKVSTPVNSLDFSLWSKRFGVPGGDDNALQADPDNDGLSNIMEFTFSTHPRVPTPGRHVDFKIVHEGNQSFTELTFLKIGQAPGTTLGVEFSEDLISWGTSEIEVVDNSFLIYRARVPKAQDSRELFYRLTASFEQ